MPEGPIGIAATASDAPHLVLARAPAIHTRLRAAHAVVNATIPIGVSISPMLPIRDIEAFAEMVAALGVAE